MILGQSEQPSADSAQKTGHTGVSAPVLQSPSDVAYPKGARGDASVIVELVIDKTGKVREVASVRGTDPFAETARRAASEWTFLPAERDGQPVSARIRLLVSFTEPTAPPSEEPAFNAAPAPNTPNTARPDPTPKPEEPIAITVTGTRQERSHALTRAEVRVLPGAFGDPFRAVEALPGVTPIASGLPYFYVRGAPPGNVGYFFDGVRVPTLYHAAVGPSVIHPAFVDDVKLHSGAYPARYGRFAGGIVTADAAAPRNEFHGEANLRLVDAGAMVEAPFASGAADIMLAGRYSYTGAIVSLIVPELSLTYWDYQARVGYDLSAKDRVSVFAFGALDYAAQEENPGAEEIIYDIRFHRLDVRYDRRTSDSGMLRVAATIGDDRTSNDSYHVRARLAGTRLEYAERLGERVQLRAGADMNFDTYRINERQGSDDEAVPPITTHDDMTFGARADLAIDVGSGISVTPGLRWDHYTSNGTSVHAAEPRISGRFKINDRITLSNDFGVAHQMPSYVVPIPGFQPDLGNGLQRSLQSSAGVEVQLPSSISASLTAFQNVFFNSTDRLGVSRLTPAQAGDDDSPDLADKIGLTAEDVRSHGRAVGLELLVRRRLTERLGGFVSYTLSRSERSAGRAKGPATFDRTHVLNVAVSYDIGRGYRLGGRAMFYSGIPARVPYIEAARVPPRTPPFFRFDWRFEKRWNIGRSGAFLALVAEVLNTTLTREVVNMSCTTYRCKQDVVGPFTIPSVGVEAVF